MKPININEDCKFLKDLAGNGKDNGVDTTNVNLGMYNLICSKRDLQLYCKGIKPHRNWKISSVKEYFGMNGNREELSRKLDLLYQVLTERK